MRLPRPRLPRFRRRSTAEGPPRKRPPRFVRIRDLLEDARHAVARRLRRVGRALRNALGLIAIPFLAAGRVARRGGHAISDFWFRRSLSFRRRTAVVALVLIAYAVIRWVAVPGVP